MNLKPEAINKGLTLLAQAILTAQQFRNCIQGENKVMECLVEVLATEYRRLEEQYLEPHKGGEAPPAPLPS